MKHKYPEGKRSCRFQQELTQRASWGLPVDHLYVKFLQHQKLPPGLFCKKRCSKVNFTKFAEKDLCESLFFNKVGNLRPATLLKKRLWYRCFPVNFVKFLRTPFIMEHLWWLLLSISILKLMGCIGYLDNLKINNCRRTWWFKKVQGSNHWRVLLTEKWLS